MKAFSLWKGPVSSEALRKGVESSVDSFAVGPVLCFVLALFNG